MDDAQYAEKRKYARSKFEAYVAVYPVDPSVEGSTPEQEPKPLTVRSHDISEGGIALDVGSQNFEASIVKMSFKIEKKQWVEAYAKLAWKKDSLRGFQFTELDEKARSKIKNYVSHTVHLPTKKEQPVSTLKRLLDAYRSELRAASEAGVAPGRDGSIRLTWERPMFRGEWHDLHFTDIAQTIAEGARGVYVLFYVNRESKLPVAVAVGTGVLQQRILGHRDDPQIGNLKSNAWGGRFYFTWAEVEEEKFGGVEKYLVDRLDPQIASIDVAVRPIRVNLPWEEVFGS
jgi:hypothetical protein